VICYCEQDTGILLCQKKVNVVTEMSGCEFVKYVCFVQLVISNSSVLYLIPIFKEIQSQRLS